MIEMKALRTFHGSAEGETIRRGREFTARDDRRANELEAHGLAYRMQGKPAKAAVGATVEGAQNRAAETGPFDSHGGPTGADAPVPSSPPARQRRTRRSTNSGTDLLS